jgi:hypothetical protein
VKLLRASRTAITRSSRPSLLHGRHAGLAPAAGAQSGFRARARRIPRDPAMIYKFKSKATGDLIMLGPNGDQLLRLLGREPTPKGIFEPDAMPALVATLKAAVQADEAARAERQAAAEDDGADPGTAGRSVSLRQRVWPMVEMLGRAHAAGQPVVWGV